MQAFEDKYIPEPNSGCWIWLYGTSSDGYGKIKYKGKTLRAHRFSYELYKRQPIPKNLLLRHTCHTTLCVNPDHLVVGTVQDNSNDMKNANRQAKYEQHGRAKLTWNSIENIRQSKLSTAELARLYMVGESTIRHVRQNRTWII